MQLLSYSFKYKIFFFLLHTHCTKIQAQLKVTTSLLVLILLLQRKNNHVVNVLLGSMLLTLKASQLFVYDVQDFFAYQNFPA